MKQAKEAELAQLEKKEVDKKKEERRKKTTQKYAGVRFFGEYEYDTCHSFSLPKHLNSSLKSSILPERRKLERRLAAARKTLAASTTEEEQKSTQEKISELEADLDYVVVGLNGFLLLCHLCSTTLNMFRLTNSGHLCSELS